MALSPWGGSRSDKYNAPGMAVGSKFKKGEHVYINTLTHTNRYYMQYPSDILGEKAKVISSSLMSGYMTKGKVLYRVEACKVPNKHDTKKLALWNIMEEDMDRVLTYKPLTAMPTLWKGLEKLGLSKSKSQYSHAAWYYLYQQNHAVYSPKKLSTLWHYLARNHVNPNVCGTCWSGNCNKCTKGQAEIQKPIDKLWAVKSTNSACWANLSSDWESFHEVFEDHPSHILVRLSVNDLISNTGMRYDDVNPVLSYFRAMKKRRVLPQDIKFNFKEGDGLFIQFGILEWSIEQIFFFLCVLRNPCEQPFITKIAQHFIGKGVDPILASVLGHAMPIMWSGGHAYIYPTLIRTGAKFVFPDKKTTVYVPNMKECAKLANRLYKFATSKRTTVPEYVRKKNKFPSWQLENTINNTRTSYKREHLDWDEAVRFSSGQPNRRAA